MTTNFKATTWIFEKQPKKIELLSQRWRWTIVYWTTKKFQATPKKFPSGDHKFSIAHYGNQKWVIENLWSPTSMIKKLGD